MDSSILFNKSIDQCRSIGRRGGLRAARNRRRRASQLLPAAPAQVDTPVDAETMAEATARIDALCPWLVGVEIGAAKRRLRLAAAAR